MQPGTLGRSIASILWIPGLVLHGCQVTLLYDLDKEIQKLRQSPGNDGFVITRTELYHNLLQCRADP